MLRAVTCLVLIVVGATSMAWGMDILRQIETALGEGSGLAGAIRVFVVRISPSAQAQVDYYRWQAEVLLIAGAVLLVCGVLIGVGMRWLTGSTAAKRPKGTRGTKVKGKAQAHAHATSKATSSATDD